MLENKENIQTEAIENTAAEQEKVNMLFGTISYNEDSAYENFLQKMTLSQALFVLIASTNFAQAKGAFNILESETLSTAIRVIRKNSAPEKSAESSISPDTNTDV